MGAEYDLGQEGAFTNFKVLVGCFCNEFTRKAWSENAQPALHTKGFQTHFTETEGEFIRELNNVDIAWIVSDQQQVPNRAEFVAAVKKFHTTGGGLFVWADNDPYFTHANTVLSELLGGLTLTGDTPAGNNLTVGKATVSGQFGKHLVTSGITSLFEGVTICHPLQTFDLAKTPLVPVATSTDGFPVIMCASQDDQDNIVESVDVAGESAVENAGVESVTEDIVENVAASGTPTENTVQNGGVVVEDAPKPEAESSKGGEARRAADNRMTLGRNAGRIMVDCGFTKLYCNWDTAGTARYVVNATVWLLGLDYKMRVGQPLSRVNPNV